jgi:hypothetical protein
MYQDELATSKNLIGGRIKPKTLKPKTLKFFSRFGLYMVYIVHPQVFRNFYRGKISGNGEQSAI